MQTKILMLSKNIECHENIPMMFKREKKTKRARGTDPDISTIMKTKRKCEEMFNVTLGGEE